MILKALQPAGEWQMMQVEAGQWHSQEVLEGIYINQGAHTDFVEGRLRRVA